jgi:hypothetical protein
MKFDENSMKARTEAGIGNPPADGWDKIVPGVNTVATPRPQVDICCSAAQAKLSERNNKECLEHVFSVRRSHSNLLRIDCDPKHQLASKRRTSAPQHLWSSGGHCRSPRCKVVTSPPQIFVGRRRRRKILAVVGGQCEFR